jgi:MFS family permease
VVATGQGVTACIFVTCAWLVHSDAIAVWHLAVGGFVMGACFAFMGPARQAYIVDLVPQGHLGNAVALSQVANNASRVGGPAAAGVLLEWNLFGATGAYATMAVLYVVSALTLLFLPRSFGRVGIDTHVLSDVADGVRYVFASPLLRILLVFVGLVRMVGFP